MEEGVVSLFISLQKFFDFWGEGMVLLEAGYLSPSTCRISEGHKQLFHLLSVFIMRDLEKGTKINTHIIVIKA